MDIPDDLKLAQEDINKKYAATIEAENERLKPTHIKKEFTFSIVEKRRLAQQEAVGLISQQAISDIVNMDVLPRIGITPDPEIRIIYDVNVGKLTIWTPKPKEEPEIKTQEVLVRENN